jgi:hypothetical protein
LRKVEEILGEPVNSSQGRTRKHRGFLEDAVKLSEENFLNHVHRFLKHQPDFDESHREN